MAQLLLKENVKTSNLYFALKLIGLCFFSRFFLLAGSDLYNLSSARCRSAHRDIQEEWRSGDGRVRLDRGGHQSS